MITIKESVTVQHPTEFLKKLLCKVPIFPLLRYYSYQLNVDSSWFIVYIAARIFILCNSIAGPTEK